MRKFWKPMRSSDDKVEEMVDLASKGKLSRRRFVASLTAMGASATAVATFVVASQQMSRGTRPAASPQQQQNLNAHDQHLVERKSSVNSTPTPATPSPQSDTYVEQRLNGLMQDYHPDAVVEDMLTGAPLVGHDAIRERKRKEFYTMRNLDIAIADRFATGDQVVAEWVATGALHGEFLGVQGSGQPFQIRGLTVVTRDANGKIVRESLYYDLAEVHRQLGGMTAE